MLREPHITMLYNYNWDQLIDHYDCNLEMSPIMPATSLCERCSAYWASKVEYG